MQRYHVEQIDDLIVSGTGVEPIIWLNRPCAELGCSQPHRYVLDEEEGKARAQVEQVVAIFKTRLAALVEDLKGLVDL